MFELNQKTLRTAAVDFLYLMDGGYPRSTSLQLVGNRYNLDRLQRHCLHRGVFARQQAEQRRSRLLTAEQLVNTKLLVDGHNVLITTESILAGRPLIAANDGVMRDVAGISHRYRISSLTHAAVEHILGILRRHPPQETLFYLDAPIRHSGELADKIRVALKSWKLKGDAQTLKVPEKCLVSVQGVVASSDSAVLDEAQQGVDLPAAVVKTFYRQVHVIDFTFLGD